MIKSRRWVILCIFSLTLLLAGCFNLIGINQSSAGKIVSPSHPKTLFEGVWDVTSDSETDSFESLQFNEDIILFGDMVWDDITYKVKKVDAENYVRTKNVEIQNFQDKVIGNIIVATAYSRENYLGEFMKLDETKMIFFLQDSVFILERNYDSTFDYPDLSTPDGRVMVQNITNESSGVLIGLRVPEGDEYNYRTLFIAYIDSQLNPVLMGENLFFPRTSGFWELKTENFSVGGKKGTNLRAHNVSEATSSGETSEIKTDEVSSKIINFIGNDYISIEKTHDKNISRLQVLPVDNLNHQSGIKISDILDDKDSDQFLYSRDEAIAKIRRIEGARPENDEFHLENFGFTRRNGHWVINGRIYYKKDIKTEWIDFDLRTNLPEKIAYYDTLVLNWYKIRDRVPDALDAFTSPNKDIAVVKTKNKMWVYKIISDQLGEKPIAEIGLSEGTAVIMAEWSKGSYVESWQRAFSSYGAKPIK